MLIKITILASDEETGPRLKPIFVRKKERVTILEKENEEIKQKQLEYEQKKLVEERRRTTLRVRLIIKFLGSCKFFILNLSLKNIKNKYIKCTTNFFFLDSIF